ADLAQVRREGLDVEKVDDGSRHGELRCAARVVAGWSGASAAWASLRASVATTAEKSHSPIRVTLRQAISDFSPENRRAGSDQSVSAKAASPRSEPSRSIACHDPRVRTARFLAPAVAGAIVLAASADTPPAPAQTATVTAPPPAPP